ncbi:hypothetical protein EYF80_009495 [Liparis tanakae]|uniref:Uncharacterized protein n=1 Tax=Liparis tanakae TaxID=230148 RepID=A0A4Z2IQ95_9TELE|nr:hypothetical protein EYF80_009495 [Liparis tanakae]
MQREGGERQRAMARQARRAGRVLECEPGTQSNNRDICPGNAHIHLTEDKPVREHIKENVALVLQRGTRGPPPPLPRHSEQEKVDFMFLRSYSALYCSCLAGSLGWLRG